MLVRTNADADADAPRRSAESAQAYAERNDAWRRELHVALTRARDTAWCGRLVR